MERIEGEWRCETCGHGRRLTAVAGVNVYGELGRDGLVSLINDEQFELYDSSVQCTLHPGDPLQRWFDGHWTRWVPCDNCKGTGIGRTPMPFTNPYNPDFRSCEECSGRGGAWRFKRQQPERAAA